MEKSQLLEYIAAIIGVEYLSDLRFSPYKERAQIIYYNIKNEYSKKERKDAEKYLEIEEEKEKNV